MTVPLLSVEDLSLDFITRGGTVKALENVGFDLAPGEILGVVGESGSGKSVLSFAIMGLMDKAARVTGGRVFFEGHDLLTEPRLTRRLRGRDLSMIFQSPRTALNPIRRVGQQIEDVLRRHKRLSAARARAGAIEALARVRIPDPERRARAYPFELSGGMCQRVMIAMALACGPRLLIADEPTTGLDVTTQAVVMDLIRDIAMESGMAVVFITHDLALAGEYCDRLVVMHAGHVVETAPAGEIGHAPRHPYARRLFGATPATARSLGDLAAIPGNLPDLRGDLPPCRYYTRCERRRDACLLAPPPLEHLSPDHAIRCRFPI